jgi:hypothetical protein
MDHGRLAGDTRCANLTIATNMQTDSLSKPSAIPARIRPNKRFQPCLINKGEEFFANGIFEFNITRILAFLDTDPARFPVELIKVAAIVDYGSRNLEATYLPPICRARSYLPKSRRDAITRSMGITESPKHDATVSSVLLPAGSAAQNTFPFSRPRCHSRATSSTGIRRSRRHGRDLDVHR